MTSSKAFHLGDILSITSDILVSPRLMDGVYGILNWMTGDDLMTHQLPRAARQCKGPLLAQHPDLASVQVPEGIRGAELHAWLAEQVALYGETRDVTPLAAGEYTHVDPLSEFRTVAPQAEIIAVRLPGNQRGAEA